MGDAIGAPQSLHSWGFTRDWPQWINAWEVDGLVDYLYRTVAQEVVPRFNDFVQRTP